MERQSIIEQLKHIGIVIEDLEKLRNLEEDLTYEVESNAKLQYNLSMIIDVSTDIMESWKSVLEAQLSEISKYSSEETELLQIALSNFRCQLEDRLDDDCEHAELIDKMNRCDKLFEKLLNAEN